MEQTKAWWWDDDWNGDLKCRDRECERDEHPNCYKEAVGGLIEKAVSRGREQGLREAREMVIRAQEDWLKLYVDVGSLLIVGEHKKIIGELDSLLSQQEKDPIIGVDLAAGQDQGCIVRGTHNPDGSVTIFDVEYPPQQEGKE